MHAPWCINDCSCGTVALIYVIVILFLLWLYYFSFSPSTIIVSSKNEKPVKRSSFVDFLAYPLWQLKCLSILKKVVKIVHVVVIKAKRNNAHLLCVGQRVHWTYFWIEIVVMFDYHWLGRIKIRCFKRDTNGTKWKNKLTTSWINTKKTKHFLNLGRQVKNSQQWPFGELINHDGIHVLIKCFGASF